jgi:FAD:protein FMN transferase
MPPSRVTLPFKSMASACEIRVEGAEPEGLAAAARAAIAEVRRIETTFSRYRPDSVVSRINAAAGTGQAVKVDTETDALLQFADQLHASSDGLFDITSGVLRRAWDFHTGQLPGSGQLEALLPLVGWTQVHRQPGEISLLQAGMELDFGGFGKEYAADRAATVLQAHGVAHGYVNLGGDIRVLGPQADGRPWRLGIQHPRLPEQVVASVELSQGALATSGDYERYFERAGRRYCHVLNPFTGWPVAHWRSVSVISAACVAAGAMTTCAMLREASALAFLRDQGQAYLAVDAQGDLHFSSTQDFVS